jgi:glycosyltransferase involved in cell wall biosynthesis
MIVLVHNTNKAERAVDISTGNEVSINTNDSIFNTLLSLATIFPESLLFWCHKDFYQDLNTTELASIFKNNRMMCSFSYNQNFFLTPQIGYVENTPFIKINYNFLYPTWIMSSDVGGVHASVLQKVKQTTFKNSFEYELTSLAKSMMPKGLLCYSTPLLLKNTKRKFNKTTVSRYRLFAFTKQHYGFKKLLFLLICFFLFEKKLPLLAFLKAIPFRKKENLTILPEFKSLTAKNKNFDYRIDVIIPTIGRKKYLYDVLDDLRNQTLVPHNVIIVEQNPNTDATSELDYIESEKWPFQIIHHFTNILGACHARNKALEAVSSGWVFMADDDIRIKETILENSLEFLREYKSDAVTLSCLMENEIESLNDIIQWNTFGSGCSIVKMSVAKSVQYNLGYEFGYGEDKDYGMQLRNKGIDILYSPFEKLVHLKAPVGGFRHTTTLAWEKETNASKPSPTIMLFQRLHRTIYQTKGYKLTLFLKFYKNQKIKNPITYYKTFKKAWVKSVYWSKKLQQQ